MGSAQSNDDDDLYSEIKLLILTEQNQSEFFEKYPDIKSNIPSVVLATICIQGIIAAIGVFANLAVILVTTLGYGKQESSSIAYVTNLSISNFAFLLIGVPFKLLEDIYLKWLPGQTLCQIVIFIKFLNFFVLILFLMVMSIDRYLAVNKALSASHLRSKRASTITCMVVWFVAFAGALPLALLHSIEGDASRCSPRFPDQPPIDASFINETLLEINKTEPPVCEYRSRSVTFTAWTIFNFCYGFLIPFLLIIVCYCSIIRRVRQPTGSVNGQRKLNRVVRRKVTRMSLLLVISYIVCYAPYHFWQIFRLVGIPVSSYTVCFHVERFNHTMVYINSALHPFLYASASGQFSKQLEQAKKKILSNINCRDGNTYRNGNFSGPIRRTVFLEMKITTKLHEHSERKNSYNIASGINKTKEEAPY